MTLKAARLCGLYYRAYLLVPEGTPDSASSLVFEALTVGCVPVFLGKSLPLAFRSPGGFPTQHSVIRLSDFKDVHALGLYLAEAAKFQNGHYASHLQWKSNSAGWDKGFLRQLAHQRGNVICQVRWAQRQQRRETKLRLKRLESQEASRSKPAPPLSQHPHAPD